MTAPASQQEQILGRPWLAAYRLALAFMALALGGACWWLLDSLQASWPGFCAACLLAWPGGVCAASCLGAALGRRQGHLERLLTGTQRLLTKSARL